MTKIKMKIARSIMFISSYFPLYILLAILQTKEFEEHPQQWGIFMMVDFVLITISLLSCFLLRRTGASNSCKPTGIKRPDDKVIDYVFTYAIPLLSFSIADWRTIIVNVLLFALLWFLYIKLDLVFINPLWGIFGYISYEHNRGYIITDMCYEEFARRKMLRGCYLTNRIFLARKHLNS